MRPLISPYLPLMLALIWVCASDGLSAPAANAFGVERVSAGVGVFGRHLGLHGDVLVQGDLMLKRAKLVGEGNLILRDHRPQQLVAEASALNRLVIDNPAGVTLRGELIIQKRLVVRFGRFDTGLACLTLSDSCQILVGESGQFQPWSIALTDWKAPLSRRNGVALSEGCLNRKHDVVERLATFTRLAMHGHEMPTELPEVILSANYPPPEA